MRRLSGGLAPLALAALCVVPHSSLSAQIRRDPPADNAAYLEVGGPGGFYSLNYERTTSSVVALRVGATAWSVTNLDNLKEDVSAVIAGVTLRHDVSALVGHEEGRYVEAGAAVSAGSHSRTRYGTLESSGGFLTLVPMVGIRYQPPTGGFLYRVTVTPFVPLAGGAAKYPFDGPMMSASLSAGYAFH